MGQKIINTQNSSRTALKTKQNLENHLKTGQTLKNKKTSRKPNNVPKKINSQGVLVKHPNFLKSLEFYVVSVVLGFYCFFLVFSTSFFCFFDTSRVFCVAAASGFSQLPPLSLSKELFKTRK